MSSTNSDDSGTPIDGPYEGEYYTNPHARETSEIVVSNLNLDLFVPLICLACKCLCNCIWYCFKC